MKVVGIVNLDWANAAWNVFQALKRYGVDAHLINLRRRGNPFSNYEAHYGLMYGGKGHKNDKALADKLIAEADIYHIFESGGTIGQLPRLNLKKKPRIVSLNASKWYRRKENQARFDKNVRPHGDFFTALTINMLIDGVEIGLQPLPSDEYPIREDYSLRGEKLTLGGAPGYQNAFKRKKYPLIQKKLKALDAKCDIIMNATQKELRRRIRKNCDIFTNGIGAGSCGYSMLQGAMSGLPCLSYVKERDKERFSIDGVFPILEMGPGGEHIEDIVKLLQSEENRKYYGQLAARWARKYQSYRACYKTYLKFYQDLLEK
jgi:hypothetical protein